MAEVLPTLAEGIKRLLFTKRKLEIAVLGCDEREVGILSDTGKVKVALEQLFLSTIGGSFTDIHFYIIGPDVPIELDVSRRSPISLQWNDGASITIQFEHALFHESSFIDGDTHLDAAFALNAGIWGYDSWIPTLELLFFGKYAGLKFIVTSYTLEESEDDYDKVADYFEGAKNE